MEREPGDVLGFIAECLQVTLEEAVKHHAALLNPEAAPVAAAPPKPKPESKPVEFADLNMVLHRLRKNLERQATSKPVSVWPVAPYAQILKARGVELLEFVHAPSDRRVTAVGRCAHCGESLVVHITDLQARLAPSVPRLADMRCVVPLCVVHRDMALEREKARVEFQEVLASNRTHLEHGRRR